MDNANDEFSDLEAELRRLRPLTPPPRLTQAITRDLSSPTAASRAGRSARWWWALAPFTLAAAAAALFFGVAGAPSFAPPSAGPLVGSTGADRDVFKPVAAAAVPLERRSESLVTLADGTVARQTRESYLATITWKNPRTNASLTWSVPREEVRVVPVSYQ